MLSKQKIEKLKRKLNKLLEKLSDPKIFQNPQKSAQVLKSQSELKQTLSLWDQYQKTERQIQEIKTLLDHADLGKDAKKELKKLTQKKRHLQSALKERLSPEYQHNKKNVILEIRAGTGGEEAALFAQDLFRMYTRFAEKKGWKTALINLHPSELKGFKSVSLEINGPLVYGALKYESGVHRVQRIPVTEKGGRIHTSTATVAVLPLLENPQIKIQEKDLRIDVFRSSGPGGQSVNTTDSAVRVTHLPTGLNVSCQDEKSQHKNKAKALKILKSKLIEQEKEKKAQERGALRKLQIGTAERSEKIRTYNFPQDRVTDHRIKKSWFGIEKILNGEIEKIIQALQKKTNEC